MGGGKGTNPCSSSSLSTCQIDRSGLSNPSAWPRANTPFDCLKSPGATRRSLLFLHLVSVIISFEKSERPLISPASYASLAVLYLDPDDCFLPQFIFPIEIESIATPYFDGSSSYLNSSVAFFPINFLPLLENTASPDFILKLAFESLPSPSIKSILFLSLETFSFLFLGCRPL